MKMGNVIYSCQSYASPTVLTHTEKSEKGFPCEKYFKDFSR